MANVQVIQRHAHLASAVKLEFVNGARARSPRRC
jgi:single-strand DNA-binding protein